MAAAAIPLAVGGGLLSAYGQIQAGKAQAAAASRNAAIKRLQAEELLQRVEINIGEVFRESRIIAGTQASSYAAAGVGLDGTPLLVIEETLARATEEAALMRRDANFQASMLRAGADIEERQGKDLKKASYIGAAGSLLGTAFNVASAKGEV